MPEVKSFKNGLYTIKDEVARNQIAELEEKHDTDIEAINERITTISDADLVLDELEAKHDEDIRAVREEMAAKLSNPIEGELMFNQNQATEFSLNALWVSGETIYFKDYMGVIHEIAYRGEGADLELSKPQDFGYTPIPYVESDGTQYVDTGYFATNKTRVELQAMGVAKGWIMGTHDPEPRFSLNWTDPTWFRHYYNKATSQWTLGSISNATGFIDKPHKISYGAGSIKYDGIEMVTLDSETEFTTSNPFVLFGAGNNGTAVAGAKLKVFGFDIYEDGKLARKFVPVKGADGSVGLFDRVTATYVSNAIGNDLTYGWYIPS